MHARTTRVPGMILICALLPASLLLGRGSGVIHGELGIPKNVTTAFPSCGNTGCHAAFPNSGGFVTLSLKAPASIQKGKTANATLSLLGGVTTTTRGGFSLTTDRGKLAVPKGTTTPIVRVNSAGQQITHVNSLQRVWKFDFTSATTGLVQWHAVGQTVNGDGRTSGDSWGFYGPDSGAPGTPFRIFVNDTQVTAFGQACAGTKGFEPLLGMPKNASVGGAFSVEAHNLPPLSIVILAIGLSNTSWNGARLPVDLTPIGGKGCGIAVSLDITQAALAPGTGAGNGKAVFPIAIPSTFTFLKGRSAYLQALVIDPTGNALGLTSSMGLKSVIQ